MSSLGVNPHGYQVLRIALLVIIPCCCCGDAAISLSQVYDTMGRVMSRKIRQKLSDARTTRQGKPPAPVRESKDVAPWGGAAAGTLGAPLGGLPELDLFCLPCIVTATEVTGKPFMMDTAHHFTELCEGVLIAMGGDASTKDFTNTASVFLSPTTRAQASLRTVEESQQPRAADCKRGRSTASKAEPEIITARLDSGATCHDFVSQATADALYDVKQPKLVVSLMIDY